MCILHIVFCTVCKYVLSICKLLCFFVFVTCYVTLGMGPPLSLSLSPDHEALVSASEARLGASSERAKDTSSHACSEMESAT